MNSKLPRRDTAAHLNHGCQCVSLDHARLEAELEKVAPGFHAAVRRERPHLFADSLVFVDAGDVARMSALVAAVERIVRLEAFQRAALEWAPESARHDPGTPGAFLGYDFHVGASGPQLIEINTNAGGGMLNAVLARAQRACCAEVAPLMPEAGLAGSAEGAFMAMLRAEWEAHCARRVSSRPARADFSAPRAVAIVDNAPETQFLHPEFVLFQRLFEASGWPTVICDPAQLRFEAGQLWFGGRVIDLVYNRLTDFALDEPGHAALRAAYLADAALISPHPRAHALYADKRNLTLLTDAERLAEWGVDAATRQILAESIPHTEIVRAEHGEALWTRRRELFFKPVAGFGSRATYRGDKLTRRVFDEILANDYVAQALVPPSLRRLDVDRLPTELKLDLRCYAYAGRIQLVAARLWQGQTTNFRTPGGGFAAVVAVPDLVQTTS